MLLNVIAAEKEGGGKIRSNEEIFFAKMTTTRCHEFSFFIDDIWVKLGWFLTFVVFLDKNVEVRSCHFVYCQCQSSWNKEHEFCSFLSVATSQSWLFCSSKRSSHPVLLKVKKELFWAVADGRKATKPPINFSVCFLHKMTFHAHFIFTSYGLLQSFPRNVSEKSRIKSV